MKPSGVGFLDVRGCVDFGVWIAIWLIRVREGVQAGAWAYCSWRWLEFGWVFKISASSCWIRSLPSCVTVSWCCEFVGRSQFSSLRIVLCWLEDGLSSRFGWNLWECPVANLTPSWKVVARIFRVVDSWRREAFRGLVCALLWDVVEVLLVSWCVDVARLRTSSCPVFEVKPDSSTVTECG
ncbi:hypothetical protein Droror1_Dr00000203 [Drosera rotundifolia]